MWTIYLIDVLENLGCLVFIALLISAFAAFISGMMMTEDWRDTTNTKRTFKSACITIAVCSLFLVFIPAKKTMYLMVGAYAVERVVETPEAKEFGSKLLKVVNSKLDEMIEKEDKKK